MGGRGLLIFLFSCTWAHAKVPVILVDPGHGGSDYGAHKTFGAPGGRPQKLCEKDLALEFSLEIQRALQKSFKVYLTRSFDRDLGLHERAEMADKVKADIFISVHINASSLSSSGGFETYYLSNHIDQAVKKIESVENRLAHGHEVVVNKILADLVIERTAPESKLLAKKIHNRIDGSMRRRYGLKNRGAKPAIFYVLALSKRPSVLLEPGFLSHRREAMRLKTRAFQRDYAQSVYRGVMDYFEARKSLIGLR